MYKPLPNIDFRSIRSLRGKQSAGFEELSVQLFHGETEGHGEFFSIEGEGGDGGVEAYRTSTDSTKIAVQSKYFDKLGSSQWNQITKSVESALKNHPTLSTYIVSTPLNRTPVQTKKWNSLTAEWLDYAKSLGISKPIEFIWWGYTELAVLLVKKCYRNQLIYWLGVPDFSQGWLNRINKSNIALLGKRYSPAQHIETESGLRLEAFAWGERGKKLILDTFLKVSEQWRKVERSVVDKAKLSPDFNDLIKGFQGNMHDITSFRWPQSGYPRIRLLHDMSKAAIDACYELESKLYELNFEEREKLAKERGVNTNHQSGPYSSHIYDLQQLAYTVTDLLRATDTCLLADEPRLLLLGDAGSGKSHLIADLATSAESHSQPVLLLLGERYLGAEDPWTATLKLLGWNYSANDLLAALDQEGRLAGSPALLCIDALNESEHRRLWQSHLIEFAEKVSHYPHVKLVVSCRSDFVRITLPEAVRLDNGNAWSSMYHQGYGTEVIEAIEVYFKEFRIRAPYFPPALAEFRNPLFLKVFCEAFAGQQLPTGPLGFDQVMRARLDRLGEQVQTEIDCDPEDTQLALKAIAAEIAKAGGRPIPRSIVRTSTKKHFSRTDTSRSLYTCLLSNGILVEIVNHSKEPNQEEEVMVRFPFERFSDYFIALQILDGIKTADKFMALFEDDRRLAHFKDCFHYYENRGIARALSILVPERLGFEFAEALIEPTVRKMVIEDFLESLAWRGSTSLTHRSESILDEARQAGYDLLPTYIRLSTIPQHPFNSEYLGAKLARIPLTKRELAWTIPVANLSEESESNILGEFLDWCFRVPTILIPDEQAILAGRLLLWFCTSNHRALRKRSTIAAIRLLAGRPQVGCQLISELHAVDDPYLIERLYAVAAGVALRLPPGEGLSSLAACVHMAVFACEQVTTNIVIRDFASSILEACLAKGCLPTSIDPKSFRPPFKSLWPTIPSEEDVKRYEDDEGWRRIVWSVRSENMGGYGDFGRYVMGAEVRNFSDKPLVGPPPDADYRGQFSSTTARHWILQRVEQLGWTSEHFGEYEKFYMVGRQSSNAEELKVERISKKYQWIALREFTGLLADHYWLNQSWNNKITDFAGAWQLYAREFDPSQRLVDLGTDDGEILEHKWKSGYPDPFQDAAFCNDREAWVAMPPADFASLLRNRQGTPDPDYPWLTIAGLQEWKEPEYDRMIEGRRGTLEMWVNIRSFLVRKQDREHFIARVSKKHFYGNGVEFPETRKGWIGEYPWSLACAELTELCTEPDRIVGDVGVPHTITACDWSGGFTLIPSPQLCDMLGLEWAGEGGAFRTRTGKQEQIIGHLGGDAADWGRALLIREDFLRARLDAVGLDLVWCILAERRCWCNETYKHVTGTVLEVSAVYWLNGEAIQGRQTKTLLQTCGET